jgi:hypothetical protein
MLDDLLCGGRHPGTQRDECLGGLAPLLVRHPDHRRFQHRGIAVDRLLDLDGGDVLAARDDDVLLAVAELERAVGVE